MPAGAVSLVILSGGKSSRMGRDKADLIYQGQTFLQHQIQKGRELGIQDIYVSGYRGGEGSFTQIPDREKDLGPLGGMLSCFQEIKEGYVLVLSIDMPLIRMEDLEQLLGWAASSERNEDLIKAAILVHQGKAEPFPGIYHTSLAEQIKEELENGKGSVFRMLKKARHKVIETESPEHCFLNINDPVRYELLLRMDIQE